MLLDPNMAAPLQLAFSLALEFAWFKQVSIGGKTKKLWSQAPPPPVYPLEWEVGRAVSTRQVLVAMAIGNRQPAFQHAKTEDRHQLNSQCAVSFYIHLLDSSSVRARYAQLSRPL